MTRTVNKVLLINPPWHRFFGSFENSPQLGLCYVAAALRQSGKEVTIFDCDRSNDTRRIYSRTWKVSHSARYLEELEGDGVWKEIEETVARQAPDVVGITVRTPLYRSALMVSRIVKKLDPRIPVVWGGVHPTVLPEDALRQPEVDMVVRGEGEETFVDLLCDVDRPERVLGLSFKDGDAVRHNPARPLIQNLDELPFPAKDLALGWQDVAKASLGTMFTSRGCPYSCVFCATHAMFSRRTRCRSAENVLAETRELANKYGIRRMNYQDDDFILDWPRAQAICNGIIREKLRISWCCNARVDRVTEEVAFKLREAGCYMVSFGVETGSEETLRRIKKGTTLAQVREARRNLRHAGVLFRALMVIGFPWETRKHIDETLSFIEELQPFAVGMSIATPYPGTELYDLCVAEGLIAPDPNWSTFFTENSRTPFSKQFSPEEGSRVLGEAMRRVEDYNRRQKRALLVQNPLFSLRVAVADGLLQPKRLWDMVRYLWGHA